jgi:HAD superfamily hydrolase (TIGR01509 family)
VIKAIIFDNFGVLYPQAMGQFFKENETLFSGNPEILDKLNSQIDLGQITRKEFFEGLSSVAQIPADELQANIDRQMIPDKNLAALIRKIKPNFKTAIISDAGKEEIAVIYNDKLDSLFDEIVVSYQVGVTKPAREIYLECASRLDVKPSECIFVDDSETNLKGAREAGMQALLYPEFGKIPKELKQLAN